VRAPRAVTLVELLVVLVLIGIVAGVTGLTMHTAKPVTANDPITSAISAARDSAIRSGRSVTLGFQMGGAQREITASPDARVAADSALDLDPRTGARDAVP